MVAGAGMAGLVAAAEARRLGAAPVVLEKLERPGGSMRLSSGVVWRHRRAGALPGRVPGGDPALQRLLFERLDEDLRWLESLGAPVLARDTGNALTTGVRFDTEGLTAALTEAAGDVRLSSAAERLPEASAPTVLATGGFAASRELLREHVTPEADHVLLRAAPGSTGDGLRMGLAAGASTSAGLDEVYARAMPAPPARVTPPHFVAARAALRAPRGGRQTSAASASRPPPGRRSTPRSGWRASRARAPGSG